MMLLLMGIQPNREEVGRFTRALGDNRQKPSQQRVGIS